jgi:hypothetical protein
MKRIYFYLILINLIFILNAVEVNCIPFYLNNITFEDIGRGYNIGVNEGLFLDVNFNWEIISINDSSEMKQYFFINNTLNSIYNEDIRTSFYFSEKGYLSEVINEILGKNISIEQKENSSKIFLENNFWQLNYESEGISFISLKNIEGELLRNISFIYDSFDRLILIKDSEKGKLEINYLGIDYNCFNPICLEMNCDTDICLPLYQCENRKCFFIDCSEYDFVQDICTYDVISSIKSSEEIYNFTYNEYGDLIKVTLNGEVIESYECSDDFCKYFDGATIWYQSIILEEICNGIDDNKDGLIDEGCDQDGDLYVNPEMVCENEFYSSSNSVYINYSSEDLVLNLKENDWNLISFPINGSVDAIYLRDRFTNISQRCIVTDYFWHWDSSKLRYSRVNVTEPGKSYWVYSLNNCSFPLYEDFEPTVVEVQLNKGWNIAPFARDFNSVYPKATSAQIWVGNGYSKNLSVEKNSCDSMWVYWDLDKLVNCSRVDLDDVNVLVGGEK